MLNTQHNFSLVKQDCINGDNQEDRICLMAFYFLTLDYT